MPSGTEPTGKTRSETSKLTQVQASLKMKSEECVALEARITELEQEGLADRNRVDELEASNLALTSDLNTAQHARSDMESELVELSMELERTSHELTAVKSAVSPESESKEIATLREEIQRLEEALQTIDVEKRAQSMMVATLQKSIATAASMEESHQSLHAIAIRELEAKLQKSEAEKQALRRQLAERPPANAERVAVLEDHLNQLAAHLSDEQDRTAMVVRQLEIATTRLRSLATSDWSSSTAAIPASSTLGSGEAGRYEELIDETRILNATVDGKNRALQSFKDEILHLEETIRTLEADKEDLLKAVLKPPEDTTPPLSVDVFSRRTYVRDVYDAMPPEGDKTDTVALLARLTTSSMEGETLHATMEARKDRVGGDDLSTSKQITVPKNFPTIELRGAAEWTHLHLLMWALEVDHYVAGQVSPNIIYWSKVALQSLSDQQESMRKKRETVDPETLLDPTKALLEGYPHHTWPMLRDIIFITQWDEGAIASMLRDFQNCTKSPSEEYSHFFTRHRQDYVTLKTLLVTDHWLPAYTPSQLLGLALSRISQEDHELLASYIHGVNKSLACVHTTALDVKMATVVHNKMRGVGASSAAKKPVEHKSDPERLSEQEWRAQNTNRCYKCGKSPIHIPGEKCTVTNPRCDYNSKCKGFQGTIRRPHVTETCYYHRK